VVERLPWPDVRGKRCLDVGTYDGFFAFELERRGAAEVVAVDVADPHDWDWPPDARAEGPKRVVEALGTEHARGFDVAREALGSRVERRDMTIYEIGPGTVGEFDVVVCGSLLLHLRDPLRALEAIRSVCRGSFLTAEEIRLSLTLLHRRRALAELDGSGEKVQWWVPNAAGHERMLFAAGFAVERTTRPYAVRLGSSHPTSRGGRSGWRDFKAQMLQRALAGGVGVPHRALLVEPRLASVPPTTSSGTLGIR
jgi:tRNA (mo5U34)-methyltransferase